MRCLCNVVVGTVCAFQLATLEVRAERPPVDRMIDVGGYRLHINCIGDGSPTVILDDGLGGDSESWDKVLPEVGKYTRVCSYDRPRQGKSDPSQRQLRKFGTHTYIELRNGDDIVRDLHTLLVRAEEPGPYVLVGQSLAGLYVILYANKFPRSVAGAVLVDSAHPDQLNRQAAIIGPAMATRHHDGQMQNQEGADLDAIYAEVGATRWHTDIPLDVLARGQIGQPPPGWSPEQWGSYAQAQREMQRDLAQRSSNGKLIIAEKSGHEIHQDQPELVIDAIKEVVQAVRARSR